jgi:hypothetical protein
VAAYDEAIELRRTFGRPDYFIRIAVADQAFQTTKLPGLPGVLRSPPATSSSSPPGP